jgi:hypothetical protein
MGDPPPSRSHDDEAHESDDDHDDDVTDYGGEEVVQVEVGMISAESLPQLATIAIQMKPNCFSFKYFMADEPVSRMQP